MTLLKKKYKECINKCHSFSKYGKKCIQINSVKIQHERTTYMYQFIKYQGTCIERTPLNEPPHVKPNKVAVRPAKTQVSLGQSLRCALNK